MTTSKIRVLIVDDSAFARKVLREALTDHDDIDVVGVARDGLDAFEKVAELSPDVMTLDLMMPNLDGLAVLAALPRPGPRVIIVSISDRESAPGAEALRLGAVDIVQKPTALATDQLRELSAELVAKVRLAALARPLVVSGRRPAVVVDETEAVSVGHKVDVVVVGTSTGGPQAISRMLMGLSTTLPVPVLVALHIPAGFTDALAVRLDTLCAIHVVEAKDGDILEKGVVYLAPGGRHLSVVRLNGRLFARVHDEPRTTPHKPSVDVLFQSAVDACGARVLGVVLTGMGDDGTRGAVAIARAGGRTVVESADSCVVWGMPRSVKEAGVAVAEAHIDDMALMISRRV